MSYIFLLSCLFVTNPIISQIFVIQYDDIYISDIQYEQQQGRPHLLRELILDEPLLCDVPLLLMHHSKLLQLLMSTCLLCVIVYDMVIRYRQERRILNLFFALCTLMCLSLISNILFCLVHYIHAFNYLEGFFINVYFGVIVYYVGFKLLQAMHVRSYGFWILHGLFGLTIVFNVSVLVEKFLNDYKNCQELWYLIVNGYAIILSVALTAAGVTYTRKQKQKLQGIENPMHYKNPLPNIWIWISVNIFSQVCSFTQSMVFKISPDLQCEFSTNFGIDQYVKLLFAFLSFHLGMFSTIIFFRNKYRRELEDLGAKADDDHTRRPSVNIQLMEGYLQGPTA